MSRPAGRAAPRRAGPSWLATGAGLAALALLGFGVGLLAGVVLEEPGLVAAHLAGRSRSVALEDVVEGGGDEPAAAMQGQAAAAAPARAASETASPPRPPDVAAPPPSGLAVQVGAFAESGTAEGLAARLRERGLPVYVSRGGAPGAGRWRVRVGPVATRREAERLAERLQREERLPTWILGEGTP